MSLSFGCFVLPLFVDLVPTNFKYRKTRIARDLTTSVQGSSARRCLCTAVTAIVCPLHTKTWMMVDQTQAREPCSYLPCPRQEGRPIGGLGRRISLSFVGPRLKGEGPAAGLGQGHTWNLFNNKFTPCQSNALLCQTCPFIWPEQMVEKAFRNKSGCVKNLNILFSCCPQLSSSKGHPCKIQWLWRIWPSIYRLWNVAWF